MCDIGTLQSYLSSRECIYDDIRAPIGDQYIWCEYSALVDSYTSTLTARCDELDRDGFDISIFPVGESDRVEFEHKK